MRTYQDTRADTPQGPAGVQGQIAFGRGCVLDCPRHLGYPVPPRGLSGAGIPPGYWGWARPPMCDGTWGIMHHHAKKWAGRIGQIRPGQDKTE